MKHCAVLANLAAFLLLLPQGHNVKLVIFIREGRFIIATTYVLWNTDKINLLYTNISSSCCICAVVGFCFVLFGVLYSGAGAMPVCYQDLIWFKQTLSCSRCLGVACSLLVIPSSAYQNAKKTTFEVSH